MSEIFFEDFRDHVHDELGPRRPMYRPAVSPGKATLTSRIARAAPAGADGHLPTRSSLASAAPVQRKAADEERSVPGSGMSDWDVAFRPDLCEPAEGQPDPAPIQRKQQEEPGEEMPSSASGEGTELPDDVQAQMEASFGADFSGVRIHEGPQAASVGALAYTQGTDIHFRPGQFNPHSQPGRELLGHELAHVVQQSQGRVQASTQARGVGINDDSSLEREADEMGAKAVRDQSSHGSGASSGMMPTGNTSGHSELIQRQVAPESDPDGSANDEKDGQTCQGDEDGLSPQALGLLQRLGVPNTGLPPATLRRLSAALEKASQGVASIPAQPHDAAPVDSVKVTIVEAEYQLSLNIQVDQTQRKTRIQLSFHDSDSQNMEIAFEHSALPPGGASGRGNSLNSRAPQLETEGSWGELPMELSPQGPQKMMGPRVPSAVEVLHALLGGQDSTGDGLASGVSGDSALCPAVESSQPFDEGVEQELRQELQKVQEELDAIDKELVLAIADSAVDVAGIFDPTPISDGIATIRDLSRGDWLGAGLSAISIIPYVGDALAKPLKGTRMAKRVARLRASAQRLMKQRARLQELLQRSRKSNRLGEGGQELSKGVAQHSKKVDDTASQGSKEVGAGTNKNSGDGSNGSNKTGDKDAGDPAEWNRPKGWRLPKNGKWEGTPGNSDFIPDDPGALGLAAGDKIPFRQGYPDFSRWATESFEVAGMTGKHTDDMKLMHKKLARDKGWLKADGEPNAHQAQKWLREQGLTPHHAGGDGVQLVPTRLHGNVRHTGGAFELRNQ